MRKNTASIGHLWNIGILLTTLWVTGNGAVAQVGEVPNPNRSGDFMTGFVRGNRGYYPIKNWLVVEPFDPTNPSYGLNCRYTPNGAIRSRIARGAILQAAFRGPANEVGRTTPNPSYDAIALDRGSPWLRIRGTAEEMAWPDGGNLSKLGECYVRANLKYIAPINPDAKFKNPW